MSMSDGIAALQKIPIASFAFQIKMWATIQDPYNAAYRAYGSGVDAPRVYGPGDKVYQAAHNMIRAHACAYKRYRYMGQQGISRMTL